MSINKYAPKTEERIRKFLAIYANTMDLWMSKIDDYLYKQHTFFKEFFKIENLEKAEWKDFQSMGKYIHALNANSLAKSRALGVINHPIEHYRSSFKYLIYGEDSIDKRINSLVEGKHKIKFIGKSSINELVGHVFADEYIFLNSRHKYALSFLGIPYDFEAIKNFGKQFLDYNENVKEIINLYKEVIGHKTKLPIAIEVDQFLSWLYSTYDLESDNTGETGIINGGDNTKYWLYAPGPNASLWQTFYEEGVMAIGWNELGDLAEYESKDEIGERLRVLENTTGSKRMDKLACYEFATQIKEGDIVIAKKGRSDYIGWGMVTSEYQFRPERKDYYHVRQVEWKAKGLWEADFKLVVKTLTDITKYPDYVNKLVALLGINEEVNENQKNYWWLNANPSIWGLDETKVNEIQTYTTHNEKGNKRRIYKYFEAVQPGDLLIGYESTPTKKVKAILEIVKGIHTNQEGEVISFKKIEEVKNPIAWEGLQSISGLENCEVFINNQGSLFRLKAEEYEIIRDLIDTKETTLKKVQEQAKPYSIEDALKSLFIDKSDFERILKALKHKKNIVLQGPPGVGKTFIAKRLAKALIKFDDPTKIETVQFHQSYSYEDFIQGYRPTEDGKLILKKGIFFEFCDLAQANPEKDYFFIIDEINRGNLSKIFGELMMLIEHDKRGKDWQIRLTYSSEGEQFYIPANLHIIGTMNTADRSLAMVDYALRRRFVFIDIAPNYKENFKTHLSSLNVSATLVNHITSSINALNQTIHSNPNLGKGFLIGHSYFCTKNKAQNDVEWFSEIIDLEIGPLLEEYWFDKPSKSREEITKLKQF